MDREEVLRRVRADVPAGEWHVNADELRKARQAVPAGEYHSAPVT